MPLKSEKKCTVNKGSARHLYEYAVVRYVPSIEREEFVNIGLIMMCKRARWIKVRFSVNEDRIRILSPALEADALKHQLEGFERVVAADTKEGGEIATLDAHERFRWLTAVRSASIQTSRPHAGLAKDLEATFDELFRALVL